jgi:type IV secretion system protein VirB10
MAKFSVPDGLTDEKNRNSRPRSKILFFVILGCVVLILMLVALKMNQQQRYASARPDEAIFQAASASAIQTQLQGAAPPNLDTVSHDAPSPEPEAPPEEAKVIARPGPKITYRKKEAPVNDPALRRMQDMKLSALLAGTAKDAFTQSPEDLEKQTQGTVRTENGAVAAAGGSVNSGGRGGAGMMPTGSAEQNPDPNGGARKEEFFYTGGGERLPGGYLRDIRKSQLVAYELKIGTVIPAILLTGIDSDLPGQLLAQVSENVYDTATGRHLLIPQGSRLIGIYDSQVSYGQKRLMAVWSHLIWPDGSSLNLSGMPGIDPSGYSGFRGRVDNHYMELFMAAVVVSGFNLGYELIVDDDGRNAYGNSDSTGNKIKEAVGESVAAIGAKIADREIARQPTIRIKPGYRFSVMLNKDIVFPSAWVAP